MRAFDWCQNQRPLMTLKGHYARDLRSFVILFDFESYVRFEIQFVLMVRFEIFESSTVNRHS